MHLSPAPGPAPSPLEPSSLRPHPRSSARPGPCTVPARALLRPPGVRCTCRPPRPLHRPRSSPRPCAPTRAPPPASAPAPSPLEPSSARPGSAAPVARPGPCPVPSSGPRAPSRRRRVTQATDPRGSYRRGPRALRRRRRGSAPGRGPAGAAWPSGPARSGAPGSPQSTPPPPRPRPHPRDAARHLTARSQSAARLGQPRYWPECGAQPIRRRPGPAAPPPPPGLREAPREPARRVGRGGAGWRRRRRPAGRRGGARRVTPAARGRRARPTGRKAKDIIDTARENIAKMIGGKPQDIIFTSGGTESNNLVIHSVVKHFHLTHASEGTRAEPSGPLAGAVPHLITCTVEHDSIRLPLEHLLEEQVAAVTFVPVSKVNGQVEVEDILAAVRPATCLVTIMLANNETGVIMPISEISQRIKALNQKRAASGLPVILLHTDAAQALGKQRVDVEDLGVDLLTIVGHKFYGPRIGALYIRGLGELTPLYPMLFGGGQERNFRPGTENTPMIAGLGKAAELVTKNCEAYEAHMRDVRDYLEERLEAEFDKQRIHLNSRFPGTERLPNTCNFSIRGPQLQGRLVLAQCRTLLASVGAACHSDHADRPSPVLLSCGIPFDVARNALRLSVGRSTTRADVDVVVRDLKQAVARLEGQA
uniref:Selenocysteine lyase n=1 Tax=Canis lupus familiaris TaxID=9615 RepID=A0A8C0TBD1_CANLF